MSMRNIYRRIAKEQGVTVADVKKDMQEAIDCAYKKQNKTIDEIINQASVPCKDEIPTTEEFMQYVARRLKK
jgi:polyhydroxyalkanoate synthesis regulator phasin